MLWGIKIYVKHDKDKEQAVLHMSNLPTDDHFKPNFP